MKGFRVSPLLGLFLAFASPALAQDGIYKGQLTDTSVGNTFCGFVGGVTITVAGGVVYGKPAHGPRFSAPLEGGHFHVELRRAPYAPMVYDGDISEDS